MILALSAQKKGRPKGSPVDWESEEDQRARCAPDGLAQDDAQRVEVVLGQRARARGIGEIGGADLGVTREIGAHHIGGGSVDRIDEDAWHLFVVRHPDRNSLTAHLEQCGVQTNIHYPLPIHKQRAFAHLNEMSYPITEAIHEQVVSLPLNPVFRYSKYYECKNTYF